MDDVTLANEFVTIQTIAGNIYNLVYFRTNDILRQFDPMTKAIAGTVVYQIQPYLDNILKVMVNYLGGLKGQIAEMDDRLRFINATTLKIDEEINNKLFPMLLMVEQRVTDLIQVLNDFQTDFTKRMDDQLTEITNTIRNAYELNQNFLKSEIQQVIDSIDNTKKDIVDNVKSSASQTNENIRIMQGQLSSSIQQGTSKVIDNANANTQQLSSQIDHELGQVGNAVEKLDNDLTTTMWNIYNDFKQLVIDVVYTIHAAQVVSYKDGQTLESIVEKVTILSPVTSQEV